MPLPTPIRTASPIIWLQDTTGIDAGDDAEKAELLGLGQSLIYSIANSGIPRLEITVRKGTVAMYARRLVKDQKDGKDIQDTIDKMNQVIKEYFDNSRPKYCAATGMADEIVDMPAIRC
ncbi:MAG: hypothetical protein Pg6C_04800 [Treponemataceae bacterium]|nr:MAG: hypothetical protein Pg6C_04800 [Treponemataceae bacterium]